MRLLADQGVKPGGVAREGGIRHACFRRHGFAGLASPELLFKRGVAESRGWCSDRCR